MRLVMLNLNSLPMGNRIPELAQSFNRAIGAGIPVWDNAKMFQDLADLIVESLFLSPFLLQAFVPKEVDLGLERER
jgi:hypothetical protein